MHSVLDASGARSPLIVGVGGTTRAGSSSERMLRYALDAAAQRGAVTEIYAGPALDMPMYSPDLVDRTDNARRLVDALRRCDGVIVASPGYHGSFSGLIKNALDYTEDMARDDRVYLESRPVGLIACAAGWQATGGTLQGLRTVIHALRGWPTPLGVAVNSAEAPFDEGGSPKAAVRTQLDTLASQVVDAAARF